MATIEPPRAPDIPPEVLPLRARQYRVPKTFSSLKHRNFRLFLIGQLISLAGTWMQIIAQGWLVYEISGSEFALGLVGFASAIPALIISPVAGVVTDRMSRRNLLVATQAASMVLALVLWALTALNVVEVWMVVVLAALLGVVNSFDGPARQAFVVEMVGREDMPNAIALNSMTFNFGRIIGPAMGGALLALFGASWCFLLNGLSFLAVIVSLLMMHLPPHVAHVSSLSPWKQMKSALNYLQGQPNLSALLWLALAFSLFGISYSTVLPAFIDKELGQGADAFGTINALSGVGAVTGAFIIARWGDRGQRGRWLTWAVIAFPLILSAFALSRYYPLVLVLSALLGVGFMLTYTLINTLLQNHLADEMRGRVMSLYTLTFFGFTPFGNLLIGISAEWIGITQAIIISAALCFVTTGIVLLRTPSVSKLP